MTFDQWFDSVKNRVYPTNDPRDLMEAAWNASAAVYCEAHQKAVANLTKGNGDLARRNFELAQELAAYKESLTPSSATKSDYIGEFHWNREVHHAEEEEESWTETLTVPWTTTKEIMKAIRERAGRRVPDVTVEEAGRGLQEFGEALRVVENCPHCGGAILSDGSAAHRVHCEYFQ